MNFEDLLVRGGAGGGTRAPGGGAVWRASLTGAGLPVRRVRRAATPRLPQAGPRRLPAPVMHRDRRSKHNWASVTGVRRPRGRRGARPPLQPGHGARCERWGAKRYLSRACRAPFAVHAPPPAPATPQTPSLHTIRPFCGGRRPQRCRRAPGAGAYMGGGCARPLLAWGAPGGRATPKKTAAARRAAPRRRHGPAKPAP